MIKKFKVSNLFSFGNEVELSMEATRIKEREANNCFYWKKTKLLKVNSIHGLNGAGKTNLFKALYEFQKLILNSHITGLGTLKNFEKFKFFSESREKPIELEIEVIIDEEIYRYHIKINENKIVYEALYRRTIKEIMIYERNSSDWEDINYTKKYFSKKTLNFIPKEFKNEKSLILSAVSLLDEDKENMFTTLRNYFDEKLIVINGTNPQMGRNVTHEYLDKNPEDNRKKLLKLMNKYSMGMDDFLYESKEEKVPWEELKNSLPPNMLKKLEETRKEDSEKLELTKKEVDISTVHKVYNESKEVVGKEILDFIKYASEGTQILYNIAGGLFTVLENGGVLVIDESLGLLHTVVMEDILRFFNRKISNLCNAQLIFSGQNPYIMSEGNLRRDQITIIKKDKYGCSYIEKLSDYKNVKTSSSFSKSYLKILREGMRKNK